MAQEAHDADPAAAAALGSKKKNRVAAAAAAAASALASSSASAAAASPPIEYLSFLGSRYVRPYAHVFSFNVKQRWWGRELLEMLEAEYKNPLSSQGFYRGLISSGRVCVLKAGAKATVESGAQALEERIIQPNDRVTLQLHRHEPPVPDSEIIFVHRPEQNNEADAAAASSSPPPPLQQPLQSLASETLVVCKPAGLPVHASGRYQWNTVVGVLKQRFGIEAFPVHRLDRVTSGLLLLSLSRSNARALTAEISERLVRKCYVARVRGHFNAGSTEPVRVEADIELRGGEHKESAPANPAESDATNAEGAASAASLSADRSITPLNPFMSARVPARVQVNSAAYASIAAESAAPAADGSTSSLPSAVAAPASVKSACTEFTLLSYDGCTSLVSCRPLHGRTHQIRVHLRSLGHPIANDYLYGGTLLESNTHSDRSALLWKQRADQAEQAVAAAGGDAAAIEKARQEWIQTGCMECEAGVADAEAAGSDAAVASATPASPSSPSSAADPAAKPAAVYCHSIWLHCASYSSARWSYEAPLPHWARDGFDSAAELSRPVNLPAARGEDGLSAGAEEEE